MPTDWLECIKHPLVVVYLYSLVPEALQPSPAADGHQTREGGRAEAGREPHLAHWAFPSGQLDVL